ncbi:MAG: response regulator [Chloroflexota bacterium]|nr:response regulator [Chloroflexota bacterium]
MAGMQDKEAATATPEDSIGNGLQDVAVRERQRVVSLAQHRLEETKRLARILVVEDDRSLAQLEAVILSIHGYSVEIATTGELAIALLERSIPDCIVLDLELPGSVQGWEVFQTLRKWAFTPVLLTTSVEVPIRQYIRTCGETRGTLDHLAKPYSMQTLLKRIVRMLMITPE